MAHRTIRNFSKGLSVRVHVLAMTIGGAFYISKEEWYQDKAALQYHPEKDEQLSHRPDCWGKRDVLMFPNRLPG